MSAIETGAKMAELATAPSMAMVPQPQVPWLQRLEEHPSWPMLAQVPETMVALIPLPHFTLRDLLTMDKGRVIESACLTSELIPMKIGSVQIAWGEFELVGHALALRVTKLA